MVQEMRLQQQEKRLRMFLPKKKANLPQGCCDLQPHLPYALPHWLGSKPPHGNGSVIQLRFTKSSRISCHVVTTVDSRFLLQICLAVHVGSFPARLLISLICVAGNRDTGRKPGLNSQVKNVPPKEGREQRGSSFF